MKISRLILILLFFAFVGCEKDDSEPVVEEKIVPTDVTVKIKGYYTIDKVFDFINSFDHEVEYIKYHKFTSDLPGDSLQYVLDYLNAKPYTNDGRLWFVTGYQNAQTNLITIYPRFFAINNIAYQKDWLESMKILKLKEVTEGQSSGCSIFFHVPEGQERLWVKKFESYEFVEWADVNQLVEYTPY